MGGDWVAIQIDSVVAEIFDRNEDNLLSEKSLGFLRVVTTRAVLRDLLRSSEDLQIGDWLDVVVTGNLKIKGPRVWSLQLLNDRFVGSIIDSVPAKGKVVSLMRLAYGSQPIDPQPLGGSVPMARKKGSELKFRYSLKGLGPIYSVAQINQMLRCGNRYWGLSRAIALDVGQANFNSIIPLNELAPALYFDVGEPIWLHIHNAPFNFSPPVRANSIVVLSHWDTDHYAFGRQDKTFHNFVWIAPYQRTIGPNAFAFAKILSNHGNLLLAGPGRSSRHRRGVRLIYCSGSTKNGSGLALHLKSLGRNILFTGDADYHEIPTMSSISLDGLQLPHHGGKMSDLSTVPQATNKFSRAVVSCGLPNRYGHPNVDTITNHISTMWNIQLTARTLTSPRGSRFL